MHNVNNNKPIFNTQLSYSTHLTHILVWKLWICNFIVRFTLAYKTQNDKEKNMPFLSFHSFYLFYFYFSNFYLRHHLINSWESDNTQSMSRVLRLWLRRVRQAQNYFLWNEEQDRRQNEKKKQIYYKRIIKWWWNWNQRRMMCVRCVYKKRIKSVKTKICSKEYEWKKNNKRLWFCFLFSPPFYFS